MEVEIIAAIVGAVGVVIAAVAAGLLSSRTTSRDQTTSAPAPASDTIENKNPHAKYVGGLVDFVSGVTDSNPLKIEMAVNDDGRIILFYNKDWTVHLSHVEFFRSNNRLNFVTDSGASRHFGMPLAKEVADHLTDEVHEVLMVRLDPVTKAATSSGPLKLKIYD